MLSKEIRKIGRDRGRKAESLFKKVLVEGIEKDRFPEWIRGYERATSKDDLKGIDCWIKTDVGNIKIQIKSSKTGAEEYLKKHRGDVAVVIVKVGDGSDVLCEKIISAVSPLREKYKKKREKY